jgi:hypothetical protein
VEGQRQRNRRRAVVGALATAATVAVVGAVAFQTLGDDTESAPPANGGQTPFDPYAAFLKGTPPTTALVDGIWRVDNGEVSVMFGEDGTVQFDDRGGVVSNAAATGTYEINGDHIIVTVSQASKDCVGAELAFRAALPNPGEMRVAPTAESEDTCWPVPFGQVVLEHVLPTSKQMASLNNNGASGWHSLPGNVLLNGDWLAQGGGYVLELAADGSYLVLGDGAQQTDQGEWSLQGRELSLTSTAASGSCNPGDQFVLSSLELIRPGTLVIRGTVTQNDCGGDWTPEAWILVPNADVHRQPSSSN